MKENTMKSKPNKLAVGHTAVVIEKRLLRHELTPEEREEKQSELLGALEERTILEALFSGVKTDFKAKIESAECRVTLLSSVLRAGYETRAEELEVVFRVDDGEKDFYRMGGGDMVLTEKMVESDYVQELPGVGKP